MSRNAQKVILVRDLPELQSLTQEQRQTVAREARAWRDAFSEKVAALEKLTADDLKIRAR